MNDQTLAFLHQNISSSLDDLIQLTQDLIRLPTINPPGNEYEHCCHFLGDYLKKHGASVEYVRAYGEKGDSDQYPRLNVIARFEGNRPGPCVHFNGHIDVVEVGEGWTKEPFAAEIEDGKIYGRGACDMKGGIAASVIAVLAIVKHGHFAGSIEISGTADEESGGYGGVGHLAKNGWFSKPRVSHVIIPEPLGVDCICTGHRGVWWSEIETKGQIAHGSMPFLGKCAVRKMAKFLHLLETRLLPSIQKKQTKMPVIPERARHSTLNINSIHGGQEEISGFPTPLVPDSCRVVLDRRFLIEETLEEVKAEIFHLLDKLKKTDPDFHYQVQDLMEFSPTLLSSDAPVVKALQQEIQNILGKQGDIVVSPGTFDKKHIERFGALQDCVAYGPGILELAHQPDEYVGIDDLLQSAKVMAGACWNLLHQDQT